MTEVKIAPLIPIVKLFPHIPDTDLSFLISEALAIGQANPAILEAIDLDRDVVALEKKRMRMEDPTFPRKFMRFHIFRTPKVQIAGQS